MTASMNGSVNFSTFDGWICEFADHGKNSFIVPAADYKTMSVPDQDEFDLNNLYDVLENEILPTYYGNKEAWRGIVHQGMKEVVEFFESNRMAREYYEIMYKD
jgi:starch phosphorylase